MRFLYLCLGDDGRKVKGWDFCYRGWESDTTSRVGATEADPTPQSRRGSIKPEFYTTAFDDHGKRSEFKQASDEATMLEIKRMRREQHAEAEEDALKIDV